ncbi:MAG: hypothetical protein M1835_007030 [Candelina submexicana]|nr:MAG: hypothetical protein M1835_007030 [Candelina submexicana]
MTELQQEQGKLKEEETEIRVNCQKCLDRSHWDFLRDFYHREQVAQHQKQRLEWDNHFLSNAIRQAGYTTHNERRILNELQNELTKAQNLNKDHERARAEGTEMLEEERLEHRGTREALKFEQDQHAEMTKYTEALYEAQQKMGTILDEIDQQSDRDQLFDSAGLILDNELKKQAIQELDDSLRVKDQKYKLDIANLQRKLDERNQEIMKLTATADDQKEDDGLGDMSEASGRKRKRGGRRSRRGKSNGF